MRSASVFCVKILLLLLLKFSDASLTSKCAVNNTAVDFHCDNAYSWRLNYLPLAEAGGQNDVSITADLTNELNNGSVSLIQCVSRADLPTDYHYAVLVITEPSEPEVPVFPELLPASRTSLYLFWESPLYGINPFTLYNYTVTVIGADGYVETLSVDVNATEPPSTVLDLGGHECEEIEVQISLPGNCEPSRLAGSLLTDPPFPMAHDLRIIDLNTSVVLTWQHPENILNEYYFEYTISAIIVSTGYVLKHYTTAISSSDIPWQVYNLSDVGVGEEVNFTVSLFGDCRKSYIVATFQTTPVILTMLPVRRGGSVLEGGDGSVEVCVEVVNGTISDEISIVILTDGGTAQLGYDYTEISSDLLLHHGDVLICQSFDIILDDNILEDPETFEVSIYQRGDTPRTNIIQSSSTVTIVDDDIAYVGFNQSSYSVEEGDGVMCVCVELLGGKESYVLGKPLSVRVTSEEKTAEAGVDFIPITEITYFPPGSEPGDKTCVSIPIIDDLEEEQIQSLTFHLFLCDIAVVVTNPTAVGDILDNDGGVPSDMSPSSEMKPMPTTDVSNTSTPLPSPLPVGLEVYFVGDTPHIEGTTISFVPNTNLRARLSCYLGQDDYNCIAGETTVITGLTLGGTYTLRLVATNAGTRAKISTDIHIPASSGSCYVHAINRGLQVLDNASVLVEFGSAGPVISYTCRLDRGIEENCTHPYILSGLSDGRHRLVITPVGTLCTDVKVLPFTFYI